MANMKQRVGVDFEVFLDKIDTSPLANGLTSKYLAEVQKLTAIRATAHPPVDIKIDNYKITGTKPPTDKILKNMDLSELSVKMNQAFEKGFKHSTDSRIISLTNQLTQLAQASHMSAAALESSAKNAQALANGSKNFSAFNAKELADMREYYALIQGVSGQLKTLRNQAGKRNDFIPEQIRQEVFDARKAVGHARLAEIKTSSALYAAEQSGASVGVIKKLEDEKTLAAAAKAKANEQQALAKAKADAYREQHGATYSHYVQQSFNQFSFLESKLKTVLDERYAAATKDVNDVLNKVSKTKPTQAKSRDGILKYVETVDKQIEEVNKVLMSPLHPTDQLALRQKLSELKKNRDAANKTYVENFKTADDFYKNADKARVRERLKPDDKVQRTKDYYNTAEKYHATLNGETDPDKLKQAKRVLERLQKKMELNIHEQGFLNTNNSALYQKNYGGIGSLIDDFNKRMGSVASSPFQVGFDNQVEAANRRLSDHVLGARIRTAIEKGDFQSLSVEDVKLAQKQYGKRGTTLEALMGNKNNDNVPGIHAIPGMYDENKKILENLKLRREAATQAKKDFNYEVKARTDALKVVAELPKILQLQQEIGQMPLNLLRHNLELLKFSAQRLSPKQAESIQDQELLKAVAETRSAKAALLTDLRREIKAANPTNPTVRPELLAQIENGRQLASSTTDYKTLPREVMPDIKAYHKSEEKRILGDLREAQRTGADTSPLTSELEKHRKGYAAATAAAKEYRTVIEKFGHAFETLSRYGIVANTMYAVTNAIREVVSSVINLEDEMKNIQAITSSSESQMAVIGTSIKGIASTTAFSIKEIADAVKTVAQAGVDMKDIPRTVQSIADVATATGSQLQTAADIITTVKEVWDGIDVSTIGDRITQAVNASKLQVEDLKTIMSLNASAAKSANVSLEQSLSLDALLRNSGVKPSTIATGTTQMLRELFSPDKKFSEFLSKQYARVGETVTADDAAKRFSDYRNSDNPLVQAVAELKRIGVGDYKSIAEMERSLDSRALNVFKPLLNSTTSLQEMEARFRAGSTAAEGAATASQTVKKAMENLGDQVDILADALGEPMLKPLRNFIDTLNKKVVKPLAEEVERDNLISKSHERSIEKKKLQGDWGFKEDVLHNVLGYSSGHLAINEGENVIGAGIPSLLAQQKKQQDELQKELDSFKNYSDNPDSLKTFFNRDKVAYQGFNTSLKDVFGAEVPKDKLSEVVTKLADLQDKAEGGDRDAAVSIIKKLIGGTKDPNKNEISQLSKDAQTIRATFAGIPKGLGDNYAKIQEIVDSGAKLTKTQEDLKNTIEKLMETNPALKGAIKEDKTLTLDQSLSIGEGLFTSMSPIYEEVKRKTEELANKHISEMAKEVSTSRTDAEMTVAQIAFNERLGEELKKRGLKAEDEILEEIKKGLANTDGVTAKVITDSAKAKLENTKIEMSKTIADTVAEMIQQHIELINNLKAKATLSPSEQTALNELQYGLGNLQGYQRGLKGVEQNFSIINAAGKDMGIDPLEIAATQARESHGVPTAANPDSTAKGAMQTINSTRNSMFKRYGDLYGFGNNPMDLRDNTYAGTGYLKYLKEVVGIQDIQDRAIAYNIGEGGYKTWKKNGGQIDQLPADVQENLKIFTANYQELQKRKGAVPQSAIPSGFISDQIDQATGTTATQLDDTKFKIVDGKLVATDSHKRKLETGKNAKEKEDTTLTQKFEEKFADWLEENHRKIGKIDEDIAYLKNDSKAKSPLLDAKKALQDEEIAKRREWLEQRKYTPDLEEKNQKGKDKTRITDMEASFNKAYAKEREEIDTRKIKNGFNFYDKSYLATEDQAGAAQKRIIDLEAEGKIKNKTELEAEYKKLKEAQVSGLQMQVDFLDKGKDLIYTEDQKDDGKPGADRKKLTDRIAEITLSLDKKIKELAVNSALKSAQSELKNIESQLDLNESDLQIAESSGNSEWAKKLTDARNSLIDSQVEAAIKVIKADPNQDGSDEKIADVREKARRQKESLNSLSRFSATEAAKLAKVTDAPIEGYYQRGVNEATGYGPSLTEQKRQKEQDLEATSRAIQAYNDRMDALAEKRASDDESVRNKAEAEYQKLSEESGKLVTSFAKLKQEADDLAPTLSKELAQVTGAHIASALHESSSALKNLDKNITTKITGAIESFGDLVGDSAVKAAKGLMGLETASQEVVNKMLDLAKGKADAAYESASNAVALAQQIQEVRWNEADPVRQEMLIAQANEQLKIAQANTQIEIDQKQKELEKAQWDDSFLGKTSNIVGDMAGGILKDTVKAEVMGMFEGVLGTDKPKGTATDPIYTKNVFDGLGINAPGASGGSGAAASAGIFGSLWDKTKSLFGGQDTTDYSGTQDPAPVFDHTGNGVPGLEPTAAQTPEMINELGQSINENVTDAMTGGWWQEMTDDIGSKFDNLTTNLDSNFTGFTTKLGAMFMMSSMATQKKSALDWAQFAIGAIGTIAGGISSLGGAGLLGGAAGGGGGGTMSYGIPGTITAATGGYITGPGTSTSDSIPAMLSNGEYVLRASAVQKIGKDTLDAWNNALATPVSRAVGGAVGTLGGVSGAVQQPQASSDPSQSSETNIRVVMVDDQRRVGDFINSPAGEQTLVQFVQRNQMAIKGILG